MSLLALVLLATDPHSAHAKLSLRCLKNERPVFVMVAGHTVVDPRSEDPVRLPVSQYPLEYCCGPKWEVQVRLLTVAKDGTPGQPVSGGVKVKLKDTQETQVDLDCATGAVIDQTSQ